MIIFHTHQPWNSAEVPSLFIFLEQQKEKKMPPESWALQLRQRKQRLRILLFFNRIRKSTLLLRPGTVASADHARFLIILQTPIKSVQELAKEEGEESEVKLKGAIEISKGAILAIIGRWRHTWRATSQEYQYYMVDQGSLQGSLSRWKPTQALPPLLPHHHLRQAHGLRGCLSETVNPPSPPTFSLLLASFAANTPRSFCSQLQFESSSVIL